MAHKKQTDLLVIASYHNKIATRIVHTFVVPVASGKQAKAHFEPFVAAK